LRSRLTCSRAQRKSQTLTELLIDLSSELDDESKKKVHATLASFDEGTPPPAPTHVQSHGKRARKASASHVTDDAQSVTSADGGEAHVSASVGSNEDLDFVQEDILNTDEAENTGYMGRNSQIQWLRALETKIEQPEGEPPDMPYGPPGATGEAFNQRAQALHARQRHTHSRQPPDQDQFSGYYFYLDKSNINIDVGDPHIIPSADVADRLFAYYKAVVHSPFLILDDEFEAQLRVYFSRDQGSPTLFVFPKWKAVMNLVFAIGARYSHLIGAEWRADDHDHLIYMWRAVHLLQLDNINTLVAQPDQALIQVGLLDTKSNGTKIRPGVWASLLLLSDHRTCQQVCLFELSTKTIRVIEYELVLTVDLQGLVHDWHRSSSCASCGSAS
jgi:hypothetical protein